MLKAHMTLGTACSSRQRLPPPFFFALFVRKVIREKQAVEIEKGDSCRQRSLRNSPQNLFI